MKIVYMGTPRFSVPALEKLISSHHDVDLVVTQPDRKGNRGKVAISPVKQVAIDNAIPVIQPERIRGNDDFLAELRYIGPDLIVVAAFGQILPQDVLDVPRYGCLNIHGSILPKLRGAAPMQYAILNGFDMTGVTIMRMDAGLDTGDMIATKEIEIDAMDYIELSERLSSAGADLLTDTISDVEKGSATYIPQDDADATYAPMIKKIDGSTDFDESAEVLERKIRAFIEWPTLYSYLGDNMIKFYRAEAIDPDEEYSDFGIISQIDKEFFIVNCKEGRLKIMELQQQGKRRMPASDFLRGTRIEVGDRFKGGQ